MGFWSQCAASSKFHVLLTGETVVPICSCVGVFVDASGDRHPVYFTYSFRLAKKNQLGVSRVGGVQWRQTELWGVWPTREAGTGSPLVAYQQESVSWRDSKDADDKELLKKEKRQSNRPIHCCWNQSKRIRSATLQLVSLDDIWCQSSWAENRERTEWLMNGCYQPVGRWLISELLGIDLEIKEQKMKKRWIEIFCLVLCCDLHCFDSGSTWHFFFITTSAKSWCNYNVISWQNLIGPIK